MKKSFSYTIIRKCDDESTLMIERNNYCVELCIDRKIGPDDNDDISSWWAGIENKQSVKSEQSNRRGRWWLNYHINKWNRVSFIQCNSWIRVPFIISLHRPADCLKFRILSGVHFSFAHHAMATVGEYLRHVGVIGENYFIFFWWLWTSCRRYWWTFYPTFYRRTNKLAVHTQWAYVRRTQSRKRDGDLTAFLFMCSATTGDI